MFSNSFKFITVLTSFGPVFIIYWVTNIFQNWKKISFYLPEGNTSSLSDGFIALMQLHWPLLGFLIVLAVSKCVLNIAEKKSSILSITLKQVKPVDPNIFSLLPSLFLPWMKLVIASENDYLYFAGLAVVFILIALIGKNSFHYNLLFRLFFGLKSYEVQTTNESGYLMLSKTTIINRTHIKSCAHLTDHMLLNTTK